MDKEINNVNEQQHLFGEMDRIRTTLNRDLSYFKDELKTIEKRISRAEEEKEDLLSRIENIEIAIKNLPGEQEEEKTEPKFSLKKNSNTPDPVEDLDVPW